MSGDRENARKAYKDFLTLWKEADPDIPILKEAKAEYGESYSRRPVAGKDWLGAHFTMTVVIRR
jgi:hypothetical protein